ncbi:hypothetical protein EDB83DRAFT_2315715 [Lactarius deliciosus]|nr:hypothetical protein EDB83DRAFT_2315715 [Lactarius deliciosus]
MSNPSKSFLHSDDQQAGQVQKVKKVIQVQSQQVTITLVVRAKVPQVLVVMWRGGGGGAGQVDRVLTVLYGVGWRGSGVARPWVEVTGGMGLTSVTAGRRSRGFARGVVVTSDEQKKKKKKKKDLTRAEQVKSACGQQVGVVVGPVNRIEGVVMANFHGIRAGLSCGGVPVVEVDGDGGPRAYVWRGGGDVVSGVLGGFAQRGDDGGELELVVTCVLETIVVAVEIVDEEKQVGLVPLEK